MKVCYQDKRFSQKNLALIDEVNRIIARRGEKHTLASVFKKLVALGVTEDGRRAYLRLAETVRNARTAGLIDWDAIEGRKQKHEGDYSGA